MKSFFGYAALLVPAAFLSAYVFMGGRDGHGDADLGGCEVGSVNPGVEIPDPVVGNSIGRDLPILAVDEGLSRLVLMTQEEAEDDGAIIKIKTPSMERPLKRDMVPGWSEEMVSPEVAVAVATSCMCAYPYGEYMMIGVIGGTYIFVQFLPEDLPDTWGPDPRNVIMDAYSGALVANIPPME